MLSRAIFKPFSTFFSLFFFSKLTHTLDYFFLLTFFPSKTQGQECTVIKVLCSRYSCAIYWSRFPSKSKSSPPLSPINPSNEVAQSSSSGSGCRGWLVPLLKIDGRLHTPQVEVDQSQSPRWPPPLPPQPMNPIPPSQARSLHHSLPPERSPVNPVLDGPLPESRMTSATYRSQAKEYRPGTSLVPTQRPLPSCSLLDNGGNGCGA